MPAPLCSVLVCSRNGGHKLARLFESLSTQNADIAEVILLDDGSSPPLSTPSAITSSLPFTLLRHEASCGLIASRNELLARASGEFVFIADDDVVLDDPTMIRRGIALMTCDEMAAAVAIRQKDPAGRLMPLQPSHAAGTHQVATYYGWAHLIRRSAWHKVGPFEEIFAYGNEEMEFSLRLLDAGYKVLGDSSLSVIHDVADNAKNLPRRHFLNCRNILLTYLLRYPLERLPSWLKNFMRTARPLPDSGTSTIAFQFQLVLAVVCKLPYVVRQRRPVSTATVTRFWELQRNAQNAEATGDDFSSPAVECPSTRAV